MPDLDVRPDGDLFAELEAFGRTLEADTGAPIRGGVVPMREVDRRRARWSMFGAVAASLAVGLVGVVAVVGSRDDDPPAAGASVATRAVDSVHTTEQPNFVPLGDDPLGLVGEDGGWSLVLRERRVFPQADTSTPIDGTAAEPSDQTLPANGAAGLSYIREVYERAGLPDGVNVMYVDARTPEGGIAFRGRLWGSPHVTPPRSSGVEVADGVDVQGYRLGDDFALAVVTGPGNLAIGIEVEPDGGDDEAVVDLVQRGADYVAANPWVELPPDSGVAPPSDAWLTGSVNTIDQSGSSPLTAEPSDTTPVGTYVASDPTVVAPPTGPDVQPLGSDPLGLAAAGWSLLSRERGSADYVQVAGFDTPLVLSLGETTEAEITNHVRVETTSDTFTGDVESLRVTFYDAGSPGLAFDLATAITGGGESATDLAASVELPEGVRAIAHRQGGTFTIAAVSGEGNLVVAFELEPDGGSDEVIAGLLERAADLLVRQPWTALP